MLLFLTVADAGIRVPKGVLEGNTLDMGNYHQCINFNQPLPNSDLQGKYCVIHVPMNQNFALPEFPIHKNFDPNLLRLDNDTIRNLEEYYIMKKGFKSYTGIIDDQR